MYYTFLVVPSRYCKPVVERSDALNLDLIMMK